MLSHDFGHFGGPGTQHSDRGLRGHCRILALGDVLGNSGVEQRQQQHGSTSADKDASFNVEGLRSPGRIRK